MRMRKGSTIMGLVSETSFDAVSHALRFTNAVEANHDSWVDTSEALARLYWSSMCSRLSADMRRDVLYILQRSWSLWPRYQNALLELNADLKERGV